MRSTLRSRLAAALLLVPLGTLVAVQPAAAQHRDDDGWRQERHLRDQRPPTIFDVTPDHGDRVDDRGRTRITARFEDRRSGIDPRSVTLVVDGRDVTHRARIHDDGIRYADDLRPGRHFAQLVVRDHAGNVARRAWSFEVADGRRGRDYGWGYGRTDEARRW